MASFKDGIDFIEKSYKAGKVDTPVATFMLERETQSLLDGWRRAGRRRADFDDEGGADCQDSEEDPDQKPPKKLRKPRPASSGKCSARLNSNC